MYSWSNFYQFNLKILISLITFWLFLKRVEDTSEEVCDAYGVYVILQNQKWGKSLNVGFKECIISCFWNILQHSNFVYQLT
jgi:hypothetical protein